ncbi:MAG: hypothetical protein DRN18_00335 [Thermoplasmata archaeon]|nr:MAG: hypothetical protein DRN18_00335 [Thermoplasmata archaeon]
MMGYLLELIRAKSEGEKLLLKDHILESLKRVKQLKEFVETNNIEIREKEKFFESLAIAVFLHDLGKINYKFQKDVYGKGEFPKELEEFFRKIKNINIRDHEILSAVWCCLLLQRNDEWTKKIRTAVLLHHYNDFYIWEKDLAEIVSNYEEGIENYLKFVEENWNKIEDFLKSLIDLAKELNDEEIERSLANISISKERVSELRRRIDEKEDLIEFAEFYEIDNENPDYNFMVLLGCLRRCDYSASGDVSIEIKKDIKNVFGKVENKIKNCIKKEPDWQKRILERIGSENIVLIAPTGAGKTEFALLWNSKINKKLIYTLPLRVALNDLFHRFRENYLGKDDVDILHSTSFIEYIDDKMDRKTQIEKKITSAKLLSSPLILTTPDQVFLTSLNYYGSDKVIATYPMASIVIDEIQAYNPEMVSIIIKTLHIIKELNGNILVMTATLPPYFEPFLFNADLIPERYREYHLGFRRIDTKDIEGVKNYNLKRHRMKIVRDYIVRYEKEEDRDEYKLKINTDLDRWIEKFKEKNLFIVLNNVSKAIEVYKYLEDKRKGHDNIYLLHSRLIEKEKGKRIKEIKEKLEKGEKVIVVATQIIEASVNLDFDVMITEVSPIDSQIQRWGRIYRNRETDYEDAEPNIVVFVGKEKDGEIKIDRGTKLIYDDRVVERTIKIMKKYENRNLDYEEERKMIEEVFNEKVENVDINVLNNLKILKKGEESTFTLKDVYVAEIIKNLEFLKYFYVEKKSQAQELFRRIAGIQAVIPAVMEIYGDKIDRKIAEVIREKGDITWNELESITSVDKWEIKKRLYMYSVSIPVFMLEDLRKSLKHEFKGFYVLDVAEGVEREEVKQVAERITKYGLEKEVLSQLRKYEEDYLENMI